MRNFRTVALLGLLAAIPASSFAQGGGRPEQRPQGQANFGRLISSLNNCAVETKDLEGLTTLTAANVSTIEVGDLLRGNNQEALTNAMERNKDCTTKLSTAIAANTVLTTYLKTNKIDATRVAAIDVNDGRVVLFVQPAPAK